jgi:hypothetical protein
MPVFCRRPRTLGLSPGRPRLHSSALALGAIGWVCAGLVGCGDDGSGAAGNGLFTFEPARPGRVVGLRAQVTVDGAQLESEPIEIALEPEGASAVEPVVMARATRTAGEIATLHPDAGAVVHYPHDPQVRIAALQRVQALRAAQAEAGARACGDGGAVGSWGTHSGWACYVSQTFAYGSFSQEKAYQSYVFFAPDGAYSGIMGGDNVYVPPDWVHVSGTYNVGCVLSPDAPRVTAAWVEGLSGFAWAASLGFTTFGSTIFFDGTYGGVATGVQQDAGTSVGLGFSFLPGIVGMSINTASSWAVPPMAVSGAAAGCPGARAGALPGPDAGQPAPFAAIARDLATWETLDTGHARRDALRGALATDARPLFAMLAAPSGFGPAHHVPAATNADLWAEFFAQAGPDGCGDCPDTSLHSLVGEFMARVTAAGDDGEQIFAEGAWASARQIEIVPQLGEQAALQLDGAATVELALEVAEDLAAEGVDDETRRVAPGLVEFDGSVGEALDLGVSAAELAALVGADEAAVAGATITIDGGPRMEVGELALTGAELGAVFTPSQAGTYLFRIAVDLGTAAGPLPPAAATWDVRLAPRLARVQAGPATAALLNGPAVVIAGAPITLTASAIDGGLDHVRRPLAATVVDGLGAVIGEAAGERGFATLQLQLTPTTPEVLGAERVTIEFTDGSTGPGWRVNGRGFSTDAEVRLGDVTLDEELHIFAVMDPTRILIAAEGLALTPGPLRVLVSNPHDWRSAPVELEL